MTPTIVPPVTDPELTARNNKWRNRIAFLSGRPAVAEFLQRKWERVLKYKLNILVTNLSVWCSKEAK